MPKNRKPRSHADVLRESGYTVNGCVNAILRAWQQATPAIVERGTLWYPEMLEVCAGMAADTGHPVDRVAAVMSATSPKVHVRTNIRITSAILHNPGTRPTACMTSAYTRALQVLDSGTDRIGKDSPKLNAFYANIVGDTDRVTIDTHAAAVALAKRDRKGRITTTKTDYTKTLGRAGMYAALEHCYQLAAARVGVEPRTMQAVTWIVQRNGRHL